MTIEDKLDKLIELQIINNSLLEENLQLVTSPRVGQTVGAGAHIPEVVGEILTEGVNAVPVETNKGARDAREEAAPVEKKKKKAKKKAKKVEVVEEPELEEVESSEPQMTLDDIAETLRSVVKNGKGAQARDVLTGFNVKKLSELPESELNACFKAFQALNNE